MLNRSNGNARLTNEHSASILAFEFYSKIKEFQKQKEIFEGQKRSVNILFNDFFALRGVQKMVFESTDRKADSGMVVVTRVQKNIINWNIERLRNALSRAIFGRVVNKTYTITDMQGLTEYLKTCGVNPKIFRRYIHVEESVDESQIESLSELGEITQVDLDGCYSIISGKPYFRYTYKARNDE